MSRPQDILKTGNEAKGLQIGNTVSDFTATDIHNSVYKLSDALKKGPVVIIFYRGQWCPFCNMHLRQFQDSLQLIYSKGATVIAVSPERPEFLKRTAEKTHAEFKLLYDEGYKISYAFDVVFLPDSFQKFTYNTLLGAKLKESQTDSSERLPIPATFIIGQDSKIVWRHFDTNYKKRSKIKDIIAHLPVIK